MCSCKQTDIFLEHIRENEVLGETTEKEDTFWEMMNKAPEPTIEPDEEQVYRHIKNWQINNKRDY